MTTYNIEGLKRDRVAVAACAKSCALARKWLAAIDVALKKSATSNNRA